MAFLRKSKKKKEEVVEEEKKTSKKSPKSKDFKDLKSENKKKRKEPPKPWGKKERYLILILLLVTAGLSGVLALSARNWKLPGLPRLKVPTLDLSFLKGQTYVLEGSKEDQETSEKVVENFEKKTKDLSGVYALYVVNLDNGFSYGVNENEVMQAASLIKLPIMVGMYMEEEVGNIDLDKKYTLKDSDKLGGSGSLQGKPEGTVVTYRELIRLMGKQSDNTAFNVCRHLLGDEKMGEIITAIGMSSTSLEENQTSPSDVGLVFERLWNGDLISNEHSEELLGFMTDTIYENWIVAGVPSDVRVAHKYGREVSTVNDAGIVYTEDSYVLVIMGDGVIGREADDIFPELSGNVYDELIAR